MCSFKPGDEIVSLFSEAGVSKGAVYVCRAVYGSPPGFRCEAGCGSKLQCSVVGVDVENFCTCTFRKVQKTDWQAWLSQSTNYDEEQQAPAPKAPARKREKA